MTDDKSKNRRGVVSAPVFVLLCMASSLRQVLDHDPRQNQKQITDLQEAQNHHDEYIQLLISKNKKSRKQKTTPEEDAAQKERMEELDKYLDLIN